MSRKKYKLSYTPAARRSLFKYLDRLSDSDVAEVLRRITTLEDNPRGEFLDILEGGVSVPNVGHKHHLSGNLQHIWAISLGIGKYRLLYSINDNTVEVLGIALSENHYDDLGGRRGKFIQKTAKDFLKQR